MPHADAEHDSAQRDHGAEDLRDQGRPAGQGAQPVVLGGLGELGGRTAADDQQPARARQQQHHDQRDHDGEQPEPQPGDTGEERHQQDESHGERRREPGEPQPLAKAGREEDREPRQQYDESADCELGGFGQHVFSDRKMPLTRRVYEGYRDVPDVGEVAADLAGWRLRDHYRRAHRGFPLSGVSSE